ncbi:hypothetical protein WAI453_005720 [Rhynchosporium graminicola]
MDAQAENCVYGNGQARRERFPIHFTEAGQQLRSEPILRVNNRLCDLGSKERHVIFLDAGVALRWSTGITKLEASISTTIVC